MSAARERIDVLLLQRDLVPTREKARAMVLAGEVLVNDVPVDKPGTKVPADAQIRLRRDPEGWVGRGAQKLLGALESFSLADLGGIVGLDVGASTGGFTQVMLERGARLVHALDVGRNQLAWKLRQDPRVKVYEGVNFRYFDPAELDPPPDFATVDVSFIGLEHILPTLARALPAGGRALVLVKPQFEVGPDQVGKGGIVREPALRAAAVQKVMHAAVGAGFSVVDSAESKLPGTEGNVEFFLYLVRT